MDSPERGRSCVKRETEDNSDIISDRGKDDEGWEGDEKRKHRSSKSRKLGSKEDGQAFDNSGRERSSGDRSESRKRSSGSSRAGSDEDDYDMRRDSHSKQAKRKQEESALEKLSNWYQEGEFENKHDGGDKSGGRAHGRSGDNVRSKSTSNLSDHERSQRRKRDKDEKPHDGELEKLLDRDSKYNEKRESSRGKEHGSSEHTRNRRRLDESEATYVEKSDPISGNSPDSKHESSRERVLSSRIEPSESKSRGLDPNSDKGMKSNVREDRRVDGERNKSKGRSEAPEEENKRSSLTRENRSGKERIDNNREQKNSTGRDVAESRMPLNSDEAGNTWTRDKNKGEAEVSDRARTPERSGRRHRESENTEVDNERIVTLKQKELEKDGYRDDRSRGRDEGWVERNRDWEGSEDARIRGQPRHDDKETKSGDAYSHGRDWELQRHGRERTDNERPLGRSGGRKDGSRTEAVKTSSNYGISNENYDVIEIQTKPFNYDNGESRSAFSRRNEVGQQSDMKLERNDDEWAYPRDDRARMNSIHGPGPPGDDSKDRSVDYSNANRDQNLWRGDADTQGGKGRGQKGVTPNRSGGTQSSNSGSQPPYGNHDQGSFGRAGPLGGKGGRVGRGGRGRPAGRESQPVGFPVPMMGSPFGPLGMPPPGPMQPLTPGHGPPISPGVFIPPFSPPVVWPGARGLEMNMLSVPPSLSPIPPGPSGPRFSPNLGTPLNPGLYFNQPDPGRGLPPNLSGPGFNAMVPVERGHPPEKSSGGWVPPKSSGPAGKAPSRGEQNDYSQNFVDTGMRPQNFIRELELTNVVEDYPKLRELIQKKDEIVAKSASPPMYYKCDLKEHVLSPEFFGTKFDVILIDPPWEEYVHRAPGVTDHMEYWNLEEIMNLKVEAIADTPSFIFLWVGDGVGLEQGRQCLKKWGFRRCEDICWVKTNKNNATPALRHDSHTLFQHSKEHCLMGIKGTVRRSTDGHVIHANIDTDVIIAEEPPYGSTAKPEDMYRIVEHFSLGRRRLELFGEDHNIRSGWLTLGKELSSSNFNSEAYIRNFADKDGKVWQGGGGRNPPPEAPHLVVTTPDIEALRPKSPMKNQQQLQHQQSMSISLTTANSTNKRPTTGNSPQDSNAFGLNQEASSSNLSNYAF